MAKLEHWNIFEFWKNETLSRANKNVIVIEYLINVEIFSSNEKNAEEHKNNKMALFLKRLRIFLMRLTIVTQEEYS